MVEYYNIVPGLRVLTSEGEEGVVTHVGSGSLANAVWVRLINGRVVIERGHTLAFLPPVVST